MSPGSLLETEALEACRAAERITCGVRRLLATTGYSSVCELVLPNGRRADIVGMSGSGRVIIVEVKSSAADFRADTKWPEYVGYCVAIRPGPQVSRLRFIGLTALVNAVQAA